VDHRGLVAQAIGAAAATARPGRRSLRRGQRRDRGDARASARRPRDGRGRSRHLRPRLKTLDRFLAEPWDDVITVCDSAQERCPLFPARTTPLHWSFPDPAQATGTEDQRLAAVRRVRDAIAARLAAWLVELDRARP
jgi:arsenate reductase